MNAYLELLKGLNEKYLPMEATAQTAKIDLRGLCSSDIAQKKSLSAETEPITETSAWRWLVHFPDRNPLEVAFSPEASHAEVLDFYPDALAAEPIDPGRRRPGAPLAGEIPAGG